MLVSSLSQSFDHPTYGGYQSQRYLQYCCWEVPVLFLKMYLRMLTFLETELMASISLADSTVLQKLTQVTTGCNGHILVMYQSFLVCFRKRAVHCQAQARNLCYVQAHKTLFQFKIICKFVINIITSHKLCVCTGEQMTITCLGQIGGDEGAWRFSGQMDVNANHDLLSFLPFSNTNHTVIFCNGLLKVELLLLEHNYSSLPLKYVNITCKAVLKDVNAH